MNYQIKKEFNPYFETLLLLCNSAEFANFKNACIESLNQYGLSGKAVYEMYLTDLEKVIKEFGEQSILTEDASFFFDSSCDESSEDTSFMIFLLSLVSDHFDELQSKQDEEQLRQLEISVIKDVLDLNEKKKIKNLTDFLNFLAGLSISEKIKWKLVTIYHHPEKYFQSLVNLVEENISIYQKVYQENDVYQLIDRSIELLNDDSKSLFSKLFDSVVDNGVVYPTFAGGLSQMVFDKNSYWGLLLPEVFGDDSFVQVIDEKLLMRLKALADKSKLQILTSIKNKPKFNLELAEELGLSPGTISHHMNVLMVAELVSVEKKAGKVYYQLEEDTVASILVRLKSLLFD